MYILTILKLGQDAMAIQYSKGKRKKPVNYAIKINLIAESQFIFNSDFEELGKNKNKMWRNIIYRQKSFLFQLIKLVHYVGESSFAQVLKNITYQTKIIFSPPSCMLFHILVINDTRYNTQRRDDYISFSITEVNFIWKIIKCVCFRKSGMIIGGCE